MKFPSNCKLFLSIFLLLIISRFSMAQCEDFSNHPEGEDMGKEKHQIYRAFFKEKNYEEAFPIWQEVYQSCPAGNELHYIDGITLLKEKAKTEDDVLVKESLIAKIAQLYEGRIACFGQKINKQNRPKEGYIQYRKGFDLFYLGGDSQQALAALQTALALEKNELNAYAIYPLTKLYVDDFIRIWNEVSASKGSLPEKKHQEAKEMYETLLAMIDHNIENGKEEEQSKYAEARSNILPLWEMIEPAIYECDYFIAKIISDYEADSSSLETLSSTVSYLEKKGCPNADPFLKKCKRKIAELTCPPTPEPSMSYIQLGKDAEKNEQYEEAIKYFRQAMEQEQAVGKKAKIAYRIALIEGYKLNNSPLARKTALEALSIDPTFGEAHLLIGKLYLSSANQCKTDDPFESWTVAWVAVDEFEKGKKADPTLKEEAEQLIQKYAQHYPPKEETFYRAIKEGSSYKVGCWINQSTIVRSRK